MSHYDDISEVYLTMKDNIFLITDVRPNTQCVNIGTIWDDDNLEEKYPLCDVIKECILKDRLPYSFEELARIKFPEFFI